MKDMENKVHHSMDRLVQEKGYAAPVDVFMDIGILEKRQYEAWRSGRVPYLEAVCLSSLNKLSTILKVIRLYAAQNGWKPSRSSYMHKGYVLRFSKSGSPKIEETYATHYISGKKKSTESDGHSGHDS